MVFGLLSKERKLERIIKKATNQMTQSPERWAAMEKLRDEGSEEALYHLLKRFTFTYTKMVEDEQEKDWVVQTMVAKGQEGMPALRRYLTTSSTVAFALSILERVAEPAQALEVIDAMLADEPPGYTRDTAKRLQVIGWLGAWEGASSDELAKRVEPYLADFDEGTRFAAVAAMVRHVVPSTHPALLEALVREEEESKRLRIHIAELLAEQKVPLGDYHDRITPLLEETLADFTIQRGMLVRKA